MLGVKGFSMKPDDKSFSASFLVRGSDQWIPAESNLKPPVELETFVRNDGVDTSPGQ